MEADGNFIPDFTERFIAGTVATKNSRVVLKDGIAYISVHNRLNVWNAKRMEMCEILGTSKHAITAFAVLTDMIVIGYKNGLIEIITPDGENKKMRHHSRAVLSLIGCTGGFISSSSDGSICLYDTVLEEPRVYYKGSPVAVEQVAISEGQLYAVCADKTLRIWAIDGGEIKDARVFDDYIFSVIVRGSQALVVLRSGPSFLLDCHSIGEESTEGSDRERKAFEVFSRIRNIICHEDRVIIHMQKKLIVYRMSQDGCLGLIAEVRAESNDTIRACDFQGDDIIYLTKQNTMLAGSIADLAISKKVALQSSCKSAVIAHATDVLDAQIQGNYVHTLSKDILIAWEKVVDNDYDGLVDGVSAQDIKMHAKYSLEPIRWKEFGKATCFCLLGNSIIVGHIKGFCALVDGEIVKELACGAVSSICSFNDIFSVCTDTTVTFYDQDFTVLNELVLQEPAIYSQFAPCGQMFAVSTLDNKINVFNFPALDLKLTLYGHSLPVRSFAISADSKLLLSCGADKLVKAWGLEFGECRKNLIGNARNAEFIRQVKGIDECTTNLFAFADKSVHYFSSFNKLREYNIFLPGIVRFGEDFMIVTSERGVGLFTMNRYALLPDDASDEEDHPMVNVVTHVDAYDRFLDLIDGLELNYTESSAIALYDFLEQIDLSELSSLLYILSESAVHVLLRMLEGTINKNIVLNCRIFLMLINNHTKICRAHGSFNYLRNELLGKIRAHRQLVGENEFGLLVSNHLERIDI